MNPIGTKVGRRRGVLREVIGRPQRDGDYRLLSTKQGGDKIPLSPLRFDRPHDDHIVGTMAATTSAMKVELGRWSMTISSVFE